MTPDCLLITCPAAGCGVQMAEDDLAGQVAHMERFHPEIIEARLKREHLWDWRRNQPAYPAQRDPWWTP